MSTYPTPKNEPLRLKALERYQIMDTDFEEDYQQIVELASQVCGTPISLISFLDENRQWSKAKIGIEARNVARDHAPCSYAILEDELMEVEDMQQDDRFANNPLVTQEPHLRFYAGTSLRTHDGFRLGTLCVLDYQPRTLTQEQRFALKVLANQVMKHLELRLQMRHISDKAEEVRTKSQVIADQHQALREAHQQTKEMNEVLQDMNRRLEEEVSMRTEDLEHTIEELDTFLYRSSHDLMRPITSLQGLAMVAKKMLSEPVAIELFGKVSHTADGMHSMLGKLMEAHNVFHAKAQREPLQIEEVINQVMEITRQKIPEARWQVSLTTQLESDSWHTHPKLVETLLSNLFENAWYFRSPQPDQEMPQLRLRLREAPTEICLEVEDNGIGMAQEVQDRAFEMFYRGSEASQGNGLGLYLVAKAVEHLNGTIEMKSQVDQGTQFTFRFPKTRRNPLGKEAFITRSSSSASSATLASGS